jgi:putative transposase
MPRHGDVAGSHTIEKVRLARNTTMTDDKIIQQGLLEKSSDASLLHEMIGCGAGHGERSPDRINQRNGFRNRAWETRARAVELVIRNYAKAATSHTSLNPGTRPRTR